MTARDAGMKVVRIRVDGQTLVGLRSPPSRRKLLHTWIVLVIAKQHLVRNGRIDGPAECLSELVAEVWVILATDTTVYLSRRGKALKVNALTFAIRASDSSWHPGLPRRPLIPGGRRPDS